MCVMCMCVCVCACVYFKNVVRILGKLTLNTCCRGHCDSTARELGRSTRSAEGWKGPGRNSEGFASLNSLLAP